MNTEKPSELQAGVIERYSSQHVEAITIGKPFDGRLLFSTPARAEELHPGTDESRANLLKMLAEFAEETRVRSLAVLRVDTFNASITDTASLKDTEAEQLTPSVQLLRGDDISYFHDGISLKPNEGSVIVTGDCHTIVFSSDDSDEPVVAVHAGRNSLHRINHDHIADSDSVVFEALKKYKDPSRVRARMIAGIGPNNFTHPVDHPEYGEHNKKLLEYFSQYGGADRHDPEGKINIALTITGQLVSRGVPEGAIMHDGNDTATSSQLWSNRIDGKLRNTILVMNKDR